jgi:hypothetical protein
MPLCSRPAWPRFVCGVTFDGAKVLIAQGMLGPQDVGARGVFRGPDRES